MMRAHFRILGEKSLKNSLKLENSSQRLKKRKKKNVYIFSFYF